MKVMRHYSEAETKQYPGAAGPVGRVVIGQADGADNFCMRVFEVPPGGVTSQHAHEWEHQVFIHAGEGAVLKAGQWVPVSVGSVVFIPGNEEHFFKNTGDKPFVFVCLVPKGAPEL